MRTLIGFLLPVLILGVIPCLSAQGNPDWRNPSVEDTLRLRMLDSLTRKVFWLKQPDSALLFAGRMLDLAQQGDYGVYIRRSLRYRAQIYTAIGDYRSAIPANEARIEAYETATYDQDKRYRALSESYREFSFVLGKAGRTAEALQAGEKSIDYAEALGEEGVPYLAGALNNLGNLYFDLHNYDLAKAKYQESLALHRKINKENGIYSNLNNLGLVAAREHDYAAAIQYYEESLSRKRAKGDDQRIANTLGNIGDIYLEWKKYDEAGAYFREALEIQQRFNLQAESARSLSQLGTLALLRGQPREAIEWCEQSCRITRENENWQSGLDCNKCLYEAYKAVGRPAEALAAYENYVAVKDSIFSLENAQEIARMEAGFQYEQELAKSEAEQLKLTNQAERARRWRWLLLGGMLVFALISWLVYRVSRLRYRQNRLLRESNTQISADRELIRRQAAELAGNAETKNRFFANISHELRTPLTLIISPLQRMLSSDGPALSPELRQSLKRVQYNADTLRQLVEELLELAQLEAGTVKVTQQNVALPADLRQYFDSFVSLAREKSIDYKFNYQGPAQSILTDLQRLAKIINNLLGNALKFTPEQGYVNFNAHFNQEQGSLLLTVADSGPGIEPSAIPRIFDRYFQAGSRAEEGMGIGLALARESARLLGGDIQVESEPGQGSIFRVELPVMPAPAEEPAFVPAAQPLNGYAAGNSILLVEDHPELRSFLLDILSDYNCRAASNGEEAWQLLQQASEAQSPYQLVVTDLMMPEMDGQTLVARIKQSDHLAGTRVIVLTARHDLATKLNLLRVGIDDYLTKPFVAEELKTRVQHLLSYLPPTPPANPAEGAPESPLAVQSWLESLEETVQRMLRNQQELTVSTIAREMYTSDRQLLRRIKEATGLSTQLYLQELKLQFARQLLENNRVRTVSELALECGFNNVGYFSRLFTDRFGQKPGSLIN